MNSEGRSITLEKLTEIVNNSMDITEGLLKREKDLKENEYLEILNTVPLSLKSLHYSEDQHNKSNLFEPSVPKAFDGRHLYILDQKMGLQKFDVSSSGLGKLVAVNATFCT